METCKIKNLYNLEETIAKDLFEGAVYPWEVLPKISDFIKKLGATLNEEEYENAGKTSGSKIRNRSTDRLHSRTGDHRKRSRSTPLCIHPRQCDRR